MVKRIIFSIFISSILFYTAALYAGEPGMEVISTDPATPAVLEPGQRLYIKFRYDTGGAESVRTWVGPVSSAKGCKSHPCRSIRDKEGIYEGWFYYDDNAAEITGLKLSMKDDKDKRGNIFEDTVPISAKWKSPEEAKNPHGYTAANNSVKIISTEPVLPAILKLGEKVCINFQYDAGDAKSVTLNAWPSKEKDGSRPKVSKYSSINRDGSSGEYSYSFNYDEPISIAEIKFRLTNNDTDRVTAQLAFPVDLTWSDDKEVVRQCSTTSRVSDYIKAATGKTSSKTQRSQFDAIDAQIAKKYARKYEGVWAYKIKRPKSKPGKTIVIQGKRNEQGELNFSFLHQSIYDEPVFQKCSVDQYRANVYFKAANMPSIMYSLSRKNQNLSGIVYTSTTDQQKISLRKLTLPQAIKVIAKDYNKINRLKETLAKTRGKFKQSQGQVSEQKKKIIKLTDELNKSRKQTSESKNKYEKLQQKHSRVIKENRVEVKAVRQKHEKLTTQLVDVKKSFHDLQQQFQAKTKTFDAVIEGFEKTIATLKQKLKTTTRKLQAGQKKLNQCNKALEEHEQKGKQNERLKLEIEVHKKDQAESTEVIGSLKKALKKAKKTIKTLKQQKSAPEKSEE